MQFWPPGGSTGQKPSRPGLSCWYRKSQTNAAVKDQPIGTWKRVAMKHAIRLLISFFCVFLVCCF
jgi:hypothetical protein